VLEDQRVPEEAADLERERIDEQVVLFRVCLEEREVPLGVACSRRLEPGRETLLEQVGLVARPVEASAFRQVSEDAAHPSSVVEQSPKATAESLRAVFDTNPVSVEGGPGHFLRCVKDLAHERGGRWLTENERVGLAGC